jgi:cytokinin dehydrogenase
MTGAAALAGATVLGFSPEARAWKKASTQTSCETLARLPPLDGEVVLDDSSLAPVSTDLGLLETKSPVAVLRPGSIEDVARMVRYCNKHKIQVAARGQGHATGGQALVDCGLVIDMRTLGNVVQVAPGYAIAEGGATWVTVLERALETGQTPPVLTGFVGLSVGGTLAMGGINGMSYRHGAQIDHALTLWVVTGKGVLVECSADCNRDLFLAVLGGVGQYGIVVKAKLRLVPAKQRAVEWNTPYFDPALYFADLRTLVERAELDVVRGAIMRDPDSGNWIYMLTTAQYYNSTPPDFEDMHRGLHLIPGATTATDRTYFEFITVVDGLVAFLRSIGQFDGHMHPWHDVFVPDPAAELYVKSTIEDLSPEDVGPFGQILLFPIVTAAMKRPLLRLPSSPVAFLFDILTQAGPPGYEAGFADRMLTRNRELYESARAIGGTRYPIGSLNFTTQDWHDHYGPEWSRVRSAKAHFDPKHLLAPGSGMF